MSSSSLPVLWICGAPGAGKSVTAWSLFEKLASDGVEVAYLDIDQLGMLYPESDADPERFRLKTEALNALIPNYLASGARVLIVSGIVDSEAPAAVATQYPNARLTFCLLDTAEALLRERILERGWHSDDADEVVADAATLRGAAFVDAVIDTAGASVENVADRVRSLLSTFEPGVPGAAPTITASTARPHLLVLTGARAVGTSTAGFGLARSLWNSGVVTGFAELDQLAFLRNGEHNDRGACVLGAANLAALHEVFATHGAERVIVSAHLRDTSEHDLVRMATQPDIVTIVRLSADDETIAGHVRDRSSGSEARLAGDDLAGASARRQADIVQQARAQHERLNALAEEDVLIDVSGRSINSIVDEIAASPSSTSTRGTQTPGSVIFQHPLAYLLGLEGVALMRAFAGEYDRAFTLARIAEVRGLLDRTDLGSGIDVPPWSVAAGYNGWATDYDGEDNGCFPMRDDLLSPMLDRLNTGRVLDAACGTGAVAQQLVARGHEVVGIDISEAMISRARKAVPPARFLLADITNIPLPDGEVDHVVCSLALTHLRDLRPFFAEAARVMRSGGHLLLLDTRGHFTGSSRYPLVKESPDGQAGYMPGYSHSLGDYIRAALPHGYVVRACEETYRDNHTVEADDLPEPLTPGPPDIWELHPWVRDAANAAKEGQTAVIAWDLELRPDI
jgi:SAM-dependent methyltransferase/broad-specificity NMP kinase